MNRLSFFSGILLPALLAVMPGCGGDSKCKKADCGSCEAECADGETCIEGVCVADCAAPSATCGGACVDVQTSVAHCGSCDTACAAHGECTAGQCENPLALMQTRLVESPEQGISSVEDRDLYMLEDRSYSLLKVNGPAFDQGGVIDHSILPNGDVLMVAAQDTNGVNELYLVSPRGGTRTKLSQPMAEGGNVESGLVISGDGKKVLYRADHDADGSIDLFAVEVARPGVAVRVNGPLVTNGNVGSAVISADGTRAVYGATQDDQNIFEGYTVDLSGATPGASMKLGEGGRDFYRAQISRDGKRIVYLANDNGQDLFVVDSATPGTAHQLENADGGEGNVEAFHLVGDGSAVVYTNSPYFGDYSLWRAPLTGAPPFESTELMDGENGSTVEHDFKVTGDGARVYFRQRDAYIATGVAVERAERLYRVDVAKPGERMLLSSDADSHAAVVTDFALSRDEKSLVYRGNVPAPVFVGKSPGKSVRARVRGHGSGRPLAEFPDDWRQAFELRYVDLSQVTPAAPLLLTSPIPAEHEGIYAGYLVTNDRRVLLRADYDQSFAADVYLVTAGTPGVLRKVSPAIEPNSAAAEISVQSLF